MSFETEIRVALDSWRAGGNGRRITTAELAARIAGVAAPGTALTTNQLGRALAAKGIKSTPDKGRRWLRVLDANREYLPEFQKVFGDLDVAEPAPSIEFVGAVPVRSPRTEIPKPEFAAAVKEALEAWLKDKPRNRSIGRYELIAYLIRAGGRLEGTDLALVTQTLDRLLPRWDQAVESNTKRGGVVYTGPFRDLIAALDEPAPTEAEPAPPARKRRTVLLRAEDPAPVPEPETVTAKPVVEQAPTPTPETAPDGGGERDSGTGRVVAEGGGRLASDEAMRALRIKLSGGVGVESA
jgi:hypothetical protein